tara:strand:- start:340 stop:513 length:174 start_codon:yes stop_codon:yes gene_type:complete
MADKKGQILGIEGSEKIIPRKVERKVKTLEAMKEGGMASKKQLEELEKLKKLYPSMF